MYKIWSISSIINTQCHLLRHPSRRLHTNVVYTIHSVILSLLNLGHIYIHSQCQQHRLIHSLSSHSSILPLSQRLTTIPYPVREKNALSNPDSATSTGHCIRVAKNAALRMLHSLPSQLTSNYLNPPHGTEIPLQTAEREGGGGGWQDRYVK